MSLLEVNGLNSYYGDSHILFDVSMRVERNEVVALLGRNGAGKSTTLKSLMGVVTPKTGSIVFDGVDVAGKKSHKIAQVGMQLVHEERRIFGSLSVEENLVLAGITASKRWPLDRVYEMFPRLRERRSNRGTDLSGGEQQMLAIARALIRDPKIILLDEPFASLGPALRDDMLDLVAGLHAERGMTVLFVTHQPQDAHRIGQNVVFLDNGAVAATGSAEDFFAGAGPEAFRRYVGTSIQTAGSRDIARKRT